MLSLPLLCLHPLPAQQIGRVTQRVGQGGSLIESQQDWRAGQGANRIPTKLGTLHPHQATSFQAHLGAAPLAAQLQAQDTGKDISSGNLDLPAAAAPYWDCRLQVPHAAAGSSSRGVGQQAFCQAALALA